MLIASCLISVFSLHLLIAENGKLYTFGESENGKLGLGDSVIEANIPQHVSTIPEKVKSVSCGGSHTMVLTGTINHHSFIKSNISFSISLEMSLYFYYYGSVSGFM